MGKGLKQILKLPLDDDAPVITRLYAVGSDKNLPDGYRNGFDVLLLPQGTPYLERDSAKYGVYEATVTFDDIYPRLRHNSTDDHSPGSVTATDNDIFIFRDENIPFDVNAYKIDGQEISIVFNTGLLTGYEFEVQIQ